MVSLAANTAPIQPVEPILFYGFALLAAVGALWVVFSKQIVRMAVALLITLSGVAALYFLMEAEFIAAIQLIVYVAGTLILIVFGVMLTSKGPDVRFDIPITQRVAGWAIGLLAMILMAVIGIVGVIAQSNVANESHAAMGPTETHGASGTLEALGEALLSSYVIPLQIAAVLLLVVMIGAAFIAKGRHHEIKRMQQRGSAERAAE